MKLLNTISIVCIEPVSDVNLNPLLDYLDAMPHLKVVSSNQPPESPDAVQLVITVGFDQANSVESALTRYVHQGGAWLHIAAGSPKSLPQLFGAQLGPPGPLTELRVMFTNQDVLMAERLSEAFYITDPFQELQVSADDTETVLYADWHYSHRSVMVNRKVGLGQVLCTTLQTFHAQEVQQLFYRIILDATGHVFGQTLGVGILGYAPSVGRLHGLGCASTRGLKLVAACDLNEERLLSAQVDFPGVRLYRSDSELTADNDVDLVIVATPPNTHADLCIRVMNSSKHVVCEKPLAISQKETDNLVQTSQECGVHLSCHQNRRFDVDYRVIREALDSRLIGMPFYLETFVGGFWHPCGYWHSHAPVSGGTAYDWGAHYLDWIVSFFPNPVQAVIGTRHKRVWHDVTNADQERIQIRFHDGSEAEFIHSDIAAFRKPKWYLLGTQGAIVGNWHDVRTYDPDPDLYYSRSDIPATEMPPNIEIHRRKPSGRLEVIRPEIPSREPYAFHRNLADHLLTGEPLVAPLSDSVKVVTILEAATRSMKNGGSLEMIDG